MTIRIALVCDMCGCEHSREEVTPRQLLRDLRRYEQAYVAEKYRWVLREPGPHGPGDYCYQCAKLLAAAKTEG